VESSSWPPTFARIAAVLRRATSLPILVHSLTTQPYHKVKVLIAIECNCPEYTLGTCNVLLPAPIVEENMEKVYNLTSNVMFNRQGGRVVKAMACYGMDLLLRRSPSLCRRSHWVRPRAFESRPCRLFFFLRVSLFLSPTIFLGVSSPKTHVDDRKSAHIQRTHRALSLPNVLLSASISHNPWTCE
jgi:hypothetical protein